MSTRARIAYCQADDMVVSINLYRDGTLDVAGETLTKHYDTLTKIKNLFKIGNLLDLDVTPERSVAATPHRVPMIYRSINALLAAPENEDFDYLYIWQDGQWGVMNLND